MSSYYLWRDEKQNGPYPLDDVREMVKAGAVVNETLFCEEGADKWRPVKEWPAFYEEPRKRDWVAEARQEAKVANQPSVEPAKARVPSMHAERLAVKGGRFVLAAKVLLAFAGLAVIFAWVAMIDSDSKSGGGGFWWAAGFIGTAFWLYLIGQVLLLRAAVERLAEKG